MGVGHDNCKFEFLTELINDRAMTIETFEGVNAEMAAIYSPAQLTSTAAQPLNLRGRPHVVGWLNQIPILALPTQY